jgi:hypothetical protein
MRSRWRGGGKRKTRRKKQRLMFSSLCNQINRLHLILLLLLPPPNINSQSLSIPCHTKKIQKISLEIADIPFPYLI